MIFVRLEWSETHHDVCVLDAPGWRAHQDPGGRGGRGSRQAARDARRLRRGAAGGDRRGRDRSGPARRSLDRRRLPGLRDQPDVGEPLSGPASDIGSRVRPRRCQGARRPRPHGCPPAPDLAEEIKLLARAHQGFVWERRRHANRLRSALREFYPQALQAFGADLAASDALAVLAIAPTPELGRRLSRSKIAAALHRAGRQRNLQTRAEQIQRALRSEQLRAAPGTERAYGVVVSSLVNQQS